MRKLRVLVIMHADLIPPDDVSGLDAAALLEFRTEADVLRGLRALGHEVWPLGMRDDLAPLRRAIKELEPHIVFNLLEEFRGDPMLDQNVVSYLELVQVPYTGCNPRGLMIARDKALSKKILTYHRIPVPNFHVVRLGRTLRRKPKHLTFPLIVKSQVEEASVGISQASVVHNDEKLAERVAFIHERVRTHAIVEEFILGRELYVGVMGDARVTCLPVWELEIANLPANAQLIATRRAKWDLKYQDRRAVLIGRAEGLPPELERRLAHISRRAYRALGLGGYARIDYRLDANHQPYFLEANPNPDIAEESEFADAALAAGLEYPRLLGRLLKLGLALHAR